MAWWNWDSTHSIPSDVDTSPTPLYAPSGTTKIMPLGDSITYGIGGESQGGYRNKLRTDLTADGRTVEFVGGMSGVGSQRYQAVGGWRVEDQEGSGRSNLVGFNATDAFRLYKPRIVLAHLGTNNVTQSMSSLADYILAYRRMLDSMFYYNPQAHIFIARCILLENQWSGTTSWNNQVQSMVEAYVARGRPYYLVSGMEAMPAGSWVDGIHPNPTGYNYMSTQWKTALDAAA